VVDLRTNTVWSFKRKVLERIKELEGHGKKPTIMRWEDVVLAYKNEPKSAFGGRKPHFLSRALKRFRT
jgi:hypothetical protein